MPTHPSERDEDAAVLLRVCSEIAAHREELLRITMNLPEHEFVEMQFDQNGVWMGLVYHQPHTGAFPEGYVTPPIHMTLTGLKGRYATDEETRDAGRSMIHNAIGHFMPSKVTWPNKEPKADS